ncbi:ABC transporter ATP-binding protein [Paenibacillus sp. GCM10023252]|uniref:ABC transporter ATP-binding protein n=1 Tax=Paenibacillus sp. GCM10023252 TaxID=3252649 RepID=UPI00361903CD
MRYLSKYRSKYGNRFCLAVLLVACEAAVDLLQPAMLALIIDEGIAERDISGVIRLGGIMLLLTAGGALAAAGRNIIASQVSQNFGSELRYDLFRHIQTLSFGLIDRFDRASLVTRLTNDVTQVQNFVNGMMRIFVKAPLLCIGSLIMAVNLNPQLAVVLVIVVPIVGGIIALNMKMGFPRFMRVQQAMDLLSSTMREYLSGIRVVKAFGRSNYESAKFNSSNEHYQEEAAAAVRAMAVFNPVITLTVNLGIAAVIWISGMRINGGQMPVGQTVAFVNYMTQILFSLMMISFVLNMYVRAKASSGRIREVFAAENEMTWDEDAAEQMEGRGHISFDNVSFSYAGQSGEPILRGIQLSCKPGETIGLIGSTGSGKTSLVQLIPRFYDTSSGMVRVNGVDVRKLNPAILRERVAIVPQKTVLFSGTIRANIRWGNEEAGDEEVEHAAQLAAAHAFIQDFPSGYDTRIGQDGVNLSGGQKQRISIARALLRKPEILILDDCTSAVDASTEAAIKESLRSYASDLTCILIAQRITSVMDADQIIVLEDGEVAGIGSHKELLQECNVYREIYRSQLGKEELAHEAGGRQPIGG